MKNAIKHTWVAIVLSIVATGAWAYSNGDIYKPDEIAMISKGVPPCYEELNAWAAENAHGDATAQTPPDWVTSLCNIKIEQVAQPTVGIKSDKYQMNN